MRRAHVRAALLAGLMAAAGGPVAQADPACIPSGLEAVRGVPDSAGNANLGYAVAFAGDQLLVGAPLEDIGGLESAGAVHVYSRASGAWVEEAVLVPSDARPQLEFGSFLDVSGDRLAVGTMTSGAGDSGSAYVFTRVGGAWVEEARLLPPDPGSTPRFGSGVAISGDTLAVADGDAGVNGQAIAGAVHVYVFDGTHWQVQQRVVASVPHAFEGMASFGGLAIDGDTLVAACRSATHSPWAAPGGIHVFQRSAGTWRPAALLAPPDLGPGGYVRGAVDLEAGTIVFGVASSASGRLPLAESVRVYELDGTTWTERDTLFPPSLGQSDGFGTDLSLGGDLLVVGHERDRVSFLESAGSASVFTRVAGAWVEAAVLRDVTPEAWEMFGHAVAAGERHVAVGNVLSLTGGVQGGGTAVIFGCEGGCPDADADGACDGADNCPEDPNPGQGDFDADGIGNACEAGPSFAPLETLRLACDAPLPIAHAGGLEVADPCGGGVEIALLGEVSDGGSCVETVTRTWRALDACGREAQAEQRFERVDEAPPVVSPRAEDDRCLWPPNHRMVFFARETFSPRVADACNAPTWRIVDCVSNQPEEAGGTIGPNGDGRFAADCVVGPGGTFVAARAERSGEGREAREYAVMAEAIDACGNAVIARIATIRVPHDAAEARGCAGFTPAGLPVARPARGRMAPRR